MKRKTNFIDMSIKQQDKSQTVKFHVDKKHGVVVCTLRDRVYGDYYTAVTRCHDVDTFDEKKGRAIAFNKARRKELEAHLKMIDMEKAMLDKWYNEAIADLEKRTHNNIIYLTGVNDDLAELMK